jgi:aminoglycoside/choline kinase family phosphotransferase
VSGEPASSPGASPLPADGVFEGIALAAALPQVWGERSGPFAVTKLLGDASTRSYYRVHNGNESLIVMRLPDGGTPRALGLRELPFVAIQRQLHALDLPVPAILFDGSEQGFLLLEDLGDELFETRLSQTPRTSWRGQYEQAIELLASLHQRAAQPGDSIAYTRSFDHKLLRWELDHFREWGLDALEIPLSDSERALLDQQFEQLVAELLALPQAFTHRDYQSRNLIWAPSGQLTVIDFQDALLGPLSYDLAALLCDSYVELDEPLQLSLVSHYARLRSLDEQEVLAAFRLVSVQRKLKDAGRFVFIDQVRGNPRFLPWYGRSIRYAARALRHLPRHAPLWALLADKLAGFPDQVPTPEARTGRRSAG